MVRLLPGQLSRWRMVFIWYILIHKYLDCLPSHQPYSPGSPYLSAFNHLIHRLLDSGLLLFWEGEVARRFLNSRVQSAVKDSTTVGMQHHPYVAPVSIHLSHLHGAFIILGVGLSLATLVFLAELYIAFRDDVYNKRQLVARPSEEPHCYGFYKQWFMFCPKYFLELIWFN